MALGILNTNMHKDYMMYPFMCDGGGWGEGGYKIHTFPRDIIDSFLYMSGCKYNNTEKPLDY